MFKVIVGGINVDLTCSFRDDDIEVVHIQELFRKSFFFKLNFHVQENSATYPGKIQQSLGGVGRNIADCLARLNCGPLLISAVGGDRYADMLFHNNSHIVRKKLLTNMSMHQSFSPNSISSVAIIYTIWFLEFTRCKTVSGFFNSCL